MSFVIKSHLKSASDFKIAVRFIEKHEPCLKKFIEKIKSEGWSGQLYTKLDESEYYEPYLTHLDYSDSSKEKYPRTVWQSVKMSTVDMGEDYVDFTPSNLFEARQGFIQLVSKEEYNKYGNILPVFYDIEITKQGSYVGIFIAGTKPFHVNITQFPKVVEYICSVCFKKNVVLIAYNDIYDSTIIKMSLDREAKKGSPLTNAEYYNINHQYINYSNRLFQLNNHLTKLNSNITKKALKTLIDDEVNALYRTGFLPTNSLYNQLNSIIPHCDFYTFDMFREMFGGAGSLKHHSLSSGLKWEASLTSDNIEEQKLYNVEDLQNTKSLFDINDGSAYLKMMFEILNQSPEQRHPIRSLSTKLLVWARMCEIPENHRIVKGTTSPKYIIDFNKNIYKTHNITIIDDNINYSDENKVNMKVTYGGIHSITPSLYLDNKECNIFDIDFTSFYPHIMINPEWTFATDNYKVFIKKMMDDRIRKKKSGNDLEATALKPVINSLYGNLGKHSPLLCTTVTTIGQCIVIELLRIVEECCLQVIDVNTDGVLASFDKSITPSSLLEKIKTQIPDYPAEINEIEYILYKGIGSYLTKDVKGKYKPKGSWLSGTKYNYDDSGGGYNVTNVSDILINWVEKRVKMQPKVNKCFRDKAGYRHYSQMNDFGDKQLDSYSVLETTSPSKQNEGLEILSPAKVTDWIIQSKLKSCNALHLFS